MREIFLTDSFRCADANKWGTALEKTTVMAIRPSAATSGTRPATMTVCCLSPNRSLVDDLTPALMRCLPGATKRDIRYYPSRDQLESELAGISSNFCFLDVASDRKRGMELISQFLALSPATQIVVLLAANEPDVILKSLRLGATDFLLRPFTAEQLATVLSRLTDNSGAAALNSSAGTVYCVMPAKGGSGASTVAMNLAHHWLRGGNKPVLLADLDPLTGTVAFLMKLRSIYSFVDVLHHSETLDRDLWNAMIVRSKGMDVLLAPEDLIEGIGEIRDASPVIEFARANYSTVVLDAPGPYGSWNLSIAKASDMVLLVTTNELPALLAAQRALAYFDLHELDRSKLRLVLNRYDDEIGLRRELVSSALHMDAVQVIGSDYEVVQQAVINTKPIPANARVGKDLAALAAALSEPKHEVERPAQSGFLSLLSRRG